MVANWANGWSPFGSKAETPRPMVAQSRAGGSCWNVKLGPAGASTSRASILRSSPGRRQTGSGSGIPRRVASYRSTERTRCAREAIVAIFLAGIAEDDIGEGSLERQKTSIEQRPEDVLVESTTVVVRTVIVGVIDRKPGSHSF